MPKNLNKPIKKSVIAFLSFFLFSMILAGCGTQKSNLTDEITGETLIVATTAANDGSGSYGDVGKSVLSGEVTAPDSDDQAQLYASSGLENPAVLTVSEILAQRKIIRNANMSIEVENFDFTYGKINSIISGIGFVQETNIRKDRVFIDSEEKLFTNGVIVIRVDQDYFDEVLKDLRELGLVFEESIGSNDVTDKYFDIESRLRLLKFEQERLEKYLNSITDPDAIFKTESRLTELRYEIEGLTGTINKLNDLVDLSTITLNINEKIPGNINVPPADKPYFERLWNDFLSSLKGVLNFFGEVLLAIVTALPVILLLAVIGLVVLFAVKRRKRQKPAQENQMKENG
jgi:hypothetical protein